MKKKGKKFYYCFNFDLQISVISGEQQLKKFSKFLQKHQSILHDLVCKSPIIIANESGDGNCPILINGSKKSLNSKLNLSAKINFSHEFESISTLELIQSDNKCLNKTVVAFVQLCTEVRKLCQEGKQLLVKCLFANEEIIEHTQKNDDNDIQNDPDFLSSKKSEHSIKNYGVEVDKISLSVDIIFILNGQLETLLQTQLFIERCFVIISEIIKQFAFLFDVDISGYINVDHSSLHFQVI